MSKAVEMYDIRGIEKLLDFTNAVRAGEWLVYNGYASNIETAANGVRKNCLGYTKKAYGFKWKTAD